MASAIVFVFLSLIEFALVNKLLDAKKKDKIFGNKNKWSREQVMAVDKISRFIFPMSYAIFVFIFYNLFSE